MTVPVGGGFADFLSLELYCQSSGCEWRWNKDRSVRCHSCNSEYPRRDTWYLGRIYHLMEQQEKWSG